MRRQKETLEKRFSAKNKESEDFNQQLRELKATIREEGIARQKWKERAEELEVGCRRDEVIALVMSVVVLSLSVCL